MEMTLKDTLNDIRAVGKNGMQKSANDKGGTAASEKHSSAREELVSALHQALNNNDAPKTAADHTPARETSAVDSLAKTASALAATEQEALAKEAHLYGAAVADGFVSRLNQYDQALDTAGVKTAGYDDGIPDENEFVKFAEENPAAVQQAMEQGYNDTMAQVGQLKSAAATSTELEKLASTPEGQAEVQMLEKLASTEEGQVKLAGVRQGFLDGVADIEKLAETQEGQQKLAEIRQGYDDTMNQVTKVANDCYSRACQDTINLLEKNING